MDHRLSDPSYQRPDQGQRGRQSLARLRQDLALVAADCMRWIVNRHGVTTPIDEGSRT